MKFKQFLKSTLFGGLVVILPITIIAFFIKWIFQLITDLIQPLTNYALKTYFMPEYVADDFCRDVHEVRRNPQGYVAAGTLV